MANLSWLFYKGYYEGFGYWKAEKKDEKQILKFFREKNKTITDANLLPLPEIDGSWLELETTYPGLLIGSGYAHETGMAGEVKLGFQFDHTTGMPVIPGSSVKGVLRSAFPQFEPDKKQTWQIGKLEAASEKSREKARYVGQDLLKWTETGPELFAKVHRLEQHIFEGLNVEESEKAGKSVYHSLHDRDIFYDAVPVRGGGAGGKKIVGTDTLAPHPHPLKNPNVLPFIKILPGVVIRFCFALNAPPYLSTNHEQRWALYGKLLQDLGAGAKTAVGYGQFKAKEFKTTEETIRTGTTQPVRTVKPPRLRRKEQP